MARRSKDGPTRSSSDDVVESWLEPIAALRRGQGIPPEAARAQARLDLAVTRGLLLDLLATGDRTGVDTAVEQFIELFETWRAYLHTARGVRPHACG